MFPATLEFTMLVVRALLLLTLVLPLTPLCAEDKPQPRTILSVADAGPDYAVQGEYAGKIGDVMGGLQVVARGDGQFEAYLLSGGLPGAGFDGKERLKLTGKTEGEKTVLTGEGVQITLTGETARGHGAANAEVTFKKVNRSSPTLGTNPPEGAVVLFDGSSVSGWDGARLEDENLLGVGVRTKDEFENYTLHLEFRLPYMPDSQGQARGNSGLYLNDQYEFQILDSFGLTGENNECGAYYANQNPKWNMCLPPLVWQTYDVDFTMAKFDGAKKTHPAVATVKLNGVVIHDKYEIPRINGGGGQSDETQPGPIYLQDHGNPVRFRNIWLVEKKSGE